MPAITRWNSAYVLFSQAKVNAENSLVYFEPETFAIMTKV